MKTPISYYGGKQSMLKHILPIIPHHKIYTESFAGGAAVYWAKQPAEVEVLNDLNGNLVNFYRILKTNYPELNEKIDQTLHSREDHEFAQIVYEFPRFFDTITRAWSVWVLSKQSFASKLDGSWGYDIQKNTLPKKIQNAKDSFSLSLSRRLERTQIEQTSAINILKSRDTPETLHFVDPPYINSNCGHYSDIFNLMDFQDLLETLETLQGKFILTMFPHEMLTEFIEKNGWYRHEVERQISASKTKRRKQIELIVTNYDVQIF